MKIQFIGTGAIASKRNSASVIINDHILFDVPNGNLKAMIRQDIDILKIDTIIISHAHADHCFDIPFILWYKKNYSNDTNELPIKIITDEDTRKSIEELINLSYFNSAKNTKKEFINYKEIFSKKLFNDFDIISEPMEHEGMKYANGYIIKDKNISIGLTGDTSLCDGVKKLAKNVDLLVSDMTLEIGNDSHMGIDNILELLEENPNLKIVPTHMFDKTREQLKKLNIKNIMIVEDGDVLVL